MFINKPIYTLLLTLALITFGCVGETEKSSDFIPEGSIEEQVQFLVDQNRYDDALELLKSENQDDASIMVMKRDTHLLYGNWLMYHAETIHMTERMPLALRHFRRVIEIDPNNRQARSNIDQIESIYQQMGRPIPEGVAD